MTQQKVKEVLKDFGLTDKEAEIYIFLAKHGILRGGKIAKQTKTDRSVIYKTLKRLESRGFVQSTIEAPIRFVAVPFERVLDIIIKTKEKEALQVKKAKDDLINDWKTIRESTVDSEIEKFVIIEGIKKIYSKILQMVNETKKELYGILPVSDVSRAENFGVFDAADLHAQKADVQFRFIVELSRENLDAFKLLKEKLSKEVSFRARKSSLSIPVIPRMVIKDNKEVFFFTRPNTKPVPRQQKEACIYTNCESLVQTFKGIFGNMWSNSIDIKEKIIEIETGKSSEIPYMPPQKISQEPIWALERIKKPPPPIIGDWNEEIESAYIKKIASLEEDEKDILECAAVIGEEFSLDLIGKTLGINRFKLLKKLNNLEIRYQLIQTVGDNYRFSQPKLREMFYNTITPNLRKKYHAIIANTLEDTFKESLDDYSNKLAYHYFYSDNVEKAVPLLLKEAEKAWNPQACAYELEAIDYYSQIIDLVRDDPSWKIEKTIAFEKMGDIYSTIVQHEKANKFYEKAIKITENHEVEDRLQNKIRRKKTIEANGIRLAYYLYGKGKQTILFVGTSIHFMPQIHYFCQRNKVAVIDPTETLAPGILPKEYSMNSLLISMNKVVDDLGDGKIFLVSAVLGGTLALHYIAKYPGKINKLSLLATPPRPAFSQSPEKKSQIDQFWATAFQSPIWGWEKIKEMMVGAYSGPFIKRKKAQFFTGSFTKIYDKIPPEIKLITFKILMEADNRPLLRKIKIPTLILHGEKNQEIIPMIDIEYMNKKIKGSKMYIFKNAQWVSLTEIDKFNRVLEGFLITGQVPQD